MSYFFIIHYGNRAIFNTNGVVQWKQISFVVFCSDTMETGSNMKFAWHRSVSTIQPRLEFGSSLSAFKCLNVEERLGCHMYNMEERDARTNKCLIRMQGTNELFLCRDILFSELKHAKGTHYTKALTRLLRVMKHKRNTISMISKGLHLCDLYSDN